MNDYQDNPETSTTPTESEGRKAQFSIGKTLFWTAVIAGGLTVVKVTETNSTIDPFPQVLSLCLCIVVVCGTLSFFRDPKSIDVKFPTAMNVFISVLVLIAFFNGPAADGDPRGYGLLAIGGVPYGIFLLVLNVRRIKRREFSVSILVYHLRSWLGWTAMWTLLFLGAAGAY